MNKSNHGKGPSGAGGFTANANNRNSSENDHPDHDEEDDDSQSQPPTIPYRRDRTPSIVVQSLGLSFKKDSNITESIELPNDDEENLSQNSNSSSAGEEATNNTKSSTSGIDESPRRQQPHNILDQNASSPIRTINQATKPGVRPLPGQNRRLSLNITSSMPRRQSLTVEGSSFVNPNYPAKQLQEASVGNATGSLRNKVALKPGHSLMGWIHMASVVKDLSGTNGKLVEVTPEELAKHNREDDCWVALKGNVYNVTLYLQYHPGGVDELMRGAGSDATELFNEAHRWVNYETMLAKCLVGPYKLESPSTPIGRANFVNMSEQANEEKSSGASSTKSSNKPSNKEGLPIRDPTVAQRPPRRQSIALTVPSANKYQSLLLNNQSSNTQNLNQIQQPPTYVIMQDKSCIKIRIQDLSQTLALIRNRHLICDLNDRMELHISVILSMNWLYRIHLRLDQPVRQDNVIASISNSSILDNDNVSSNNSSNITIQLNKFEQAIWNKIGTSLDLNDSLCEMTLADKFFRPCRLLSKKQLTHDTYLFEFELKSTLMYIPIGWHVLMREHITKEIDDYRVNKNYTPVLESLLGQIHKVETGKEIIGHDQNSIGMCDGLTDETGFMKSLYFIIKIYNGGVVTSKLNQLRIGDMIEISDYQLVDFEIEKFVLQPKHWFLFAAGTGITPFIRIILYLLSQQQQINNDDEDSQNNNNQNVKSITLVFFNKTQRDIIWRNQFEELARRHSKIFKVINVLSNEPQGVREKDSLDEDEANHDVWTGKRGRINKQLVGELIDSHNPDEIQLLSCGPRAFTQLTKSIASELNIQEKLYTFHG